jgi:hypothetical protein
MSEPVAEARHLAFIKAESLPEPLRSHFPKSREEAISWQPITRYRALACDVLVVARTRVECAWAAYIGSVPGVNHRSEWQEVLRHGDKLPEAVARAVFPEFAKVPYAD